MTAPESRLAGSGDTHNKEQESGVVRRSDDLPRAAAGEPDLWPVSSVEPFADAPLDERVATLARALWREYDYALGVDPNALARFVVGVLARHDAELIEELSQRFYGVYVGQGFWAALVEVRERIVDPYLDVEGTK